MSYTLAAVLQEAIYARLSSDAGVSSLVGADVFDAAPPGSLPPLYVALGPEEAVDRSDKTGRAALHRFTISIVSEAGGFHAAKKAAAAVETALTGAPLVLSMGRVVNLGFDRARAARERNGSRRRIDLRFRALVDAT